MPADVRFDTQTIGALPVIQRYYRHLDIAAAVDRLVPWEGDVPLGKVVEIFIANRLLKPKALFRIGGWAHDVGLTDFYELAAAQLNDDLLGRALERIALHAPTIEADLVLRAIKVFDVDVGQVHRDVTTLELFGAYEQPLPEDRDPAYCPQPAYGHTKSGRKNVKQIQLELTVVGDGGIPVGHTTMDGNASEAAAHKENLRRLHATLPRSDVLHVGDTKHDTEDNLLTIVHGRGKFLCAGALSEDLQRRYLKVRGQMHVISYCPKGQEEWPQDERDTYKAHEVKEVLEGVVDGQKVRARYRLIFVWSEAKAREESRTRERHVAKIRAEFEAVERNLGKYSLKTREAIVRRLEKAKGKYAEGSLFRYEMAERGGQFFLTWGIDGKALAEWQQLEGVFVLKTNLSRSRHPVVAVLRTYKEQSQVERRIHHAKGPLAVTPMFLEKPERMSGLVCIVVWALLVMALMERQVRRGLRGKPLFGLYPENRPSAAPTGPAIIASFEALCIIVMTDGPHVSRHLGQFSLIQIRLLSLLGITEEDIHIFKCRCGM